MASLDREKERLRPAGASYRYYTAVSKQKLKEKKFNLVKHKLDGGW